MINKFFIKVKSSWGQDIHNLLLTHSPKSDSIVILFPGGDGGFYKPILYYARKAVLVSGCDVLSLEYGYFRTNNSFQPEFFEEIIKEVNETINICLSNSYKKIYFISKSLGTSIAGEISKIIGYDKVHNLFLTPTVNTIPHIINSKCTVAGLCESFVGKENERCKQ